MRESKNLNYKINQESKAVQIHMVWGAVFVITIIVSSIAGKYFIEQARDQANKTANETIRLLKETMEAAVKEAKEIAGRFSSGDITTTFRSEVPVFTSAGLGRLEVGTASSTETFSSTDKRTTAWWVYLGTTTTEIKVPVTYRYHVDLTDDWSLVVSDHNCMVKAPPLKPSLPTAIHTDRMEKKINAGWARFLESRKLIDDLEKNITPTLDKEAANQEHIDKVRENARIVVARFVRAWLIREKQWRDERLTSVTVIFGDELSKETTLTPTLTINTD
jgi:hypothetical protein